MSGLFLVRARTRHGATTEILIHAKDLADAQRQAEEAGLASITVSAASSAEDSAPEAEPPNPEA